VPRVQQYRGLALVWFDGQPEQPGFTHAWFPGPAFDRWTVAGDTALAQSGTGAIWLRASGPLAMATDGPTTGCELRLAGRRGWWLLRLGRAEDLDAFAAACAEIALTGDDPRADVSVSDPDYGRIVFRSDGRIEAEGQTIDPRAWSVTGTRNEKP
jgi:hypothetical protein